MCFIAGSELRRSWWDVTRTYNRSKLVPTKVLFKTIQSSRKFLRGKRLAASCASVSQGRPWESQERRKTCGTRVSWRWGRLQKWGQMGKVLWAILGSFLRATKKHKNAFSIKLFPQYIQNLYKTVKSCLKTNTHSLKLNTSNLQSLKRSLYEY